MTLKYVAVDTEATGLNPWGTIGDWGFHPARPFAFIFTTDKGQTTYLEWEVDPMNRLVIRGSKGDIRVIRDVLEDELVPKIFFNKNYDVRMLRISGFEVKGRTEDALFAAHVTTGGSRMSYGLKPICAEMGYPDDDESELIQLVKQQRVIGKKKHGWCIAEGKLFGREPWRADYWLPVDEVRKACKTYGIGDGERTSLLWGALQESLEEDPGMRETYEREMRLSPAIMRSEQRGTWLSHDSLRYLKKYYEGYKAKQRAIAAEEGYPDINLGSSKQLVKALFEERGNEIVKFTGKGNPSCDGEVLKTLSVKDRLAKAALENSVAAKTCSNFLDKFERFSYDDPDSKDVAGRILHTNIRQVGPITGRMAATDPNLMNIASETTGRNWADEGPRVRECFGPRPGYVWLLPDYSQIEVWLFAFQSNDPIMKQALLTGQDFHGFIAESVWGKLIRDTVKRWRKAKVGNLENKIKDLKAYYRKRAKLIMFCKLYGGGIKKVAFLLRSSYDEAAKFVHDYDTRFPGVERHSRRTIRRVQKEGFAVNPFGRRYQVDPGYEYRMVNYLIQGTAADVFKEAYIGLDELFQTKWVGAHIVMPYHDEFIIEVPRAMLCKQLMRDIVSVMQRPSERAGIPVPLPVGMKIAWDRWHITNEIKLGEPPIDKASDIRSARVHVARRDGRRVVRRLSDHRRKFKVLPKQKDVLVAQ